MHISPIRNNEFPEIENWDQTPIAQHTIESLIFNIRGVQVMLDRDLAMLYGVPTKRLNEQVKRNIERFPEDFMFQLSIEECSRSQFATLNGKRGENIKYAPFVFSENGIAMLSGVLRSPTAIAVNIQIMRAFTSMRRFLASNTQIFNRLEVIEHNQLAIQEHQNETDKRIATVFQKLDEKTAAPIQGIFYDGQIFDAHTFVCNLIRQARKQIILIDNYIDDTVLKRLDKRQA